MNLRVPGDLLTTRTHAANRRLSYRYNGSGQRIETDGPLANAKDNPGPANSDITRTEYDPTTKLVTRTIAPGNRVAESIPLAQWGFAQPDTAGAQAQYTSRRIVSLPNRSRR